MLKPINLKVNYTKPEYALADTQSPVFTWGAETIAGTECVQCGYRIIVSHKNTVLWDSGYCENRNMRAVYSGDILPSGAIIDWKLQLTDNYNNVTRFTHAHFKTTCFETLEGEWIEPGFDCQNSVVYFRKKIDIKEIPDRAVLYYCGLGYSKPYVNGNEIDQFRLQPAFTNYKKQAQYVTEPLDSSIFNVGENEIKIAVAAGWRKNYGKYLENMSSNRQIEFMGDICLLAKIVLYYEDGTVENYATDLTWSCSTSNITYSHLFNGEVFDETVEEGTPKKVRISEFSTDELKPQCIEPVCIKRELEPIKSYLKGQRRIYDFGENLAGVSRLRAKGICRNASFIIRYAEELTETGELFMDTLRSAEATDKYICADGKSEFDFSPLFTYHGFRYASVEIQGDFEGDFELNAISFYTDIDADSYFVCGNQVMNEIYKCIIRTERCNLHSIATDCPQRDERMAWMNDATVRFMSLPYNFNIARLFEKISDDIANEQGADGSLTCTAPFVFGERPADPVCSAYLVAVYEHYKQTGDDFLIRRHYDRMVKWNECLRMHAPDGIVNYSYYGDWAGPADCCYSTTTIGDSNVLKMKEYDPGAANSLYIQGKMMSTAIYYMNLCLMEYFGKIIKKDVSLTVLEKERVQKAFLEKWFNSETVSIGNNSQAECAISLYVGILPKEYEQKIAVKMLEAVKNAGMRIQTANITTPMLFEMLSKYGYTNVAWELITSTEYPSLGYMLANGATTIWERFELKKESGMNSHNHPMYGAMIGWLYRSLSGFEIVTACKCYKLRPNIPEELKYFEMKIPLINGAIFLKYENKYGQDIFLIDVPMGIQVKFYFNNKEYTLEGGFHTL